MRRPSRQTSPASWPIWLLFAAWFCTNSPQSLTYNVIVWTQGAQHFSHQERLKADVAFILAGKKLALASHWETAPPAKPFQPPIPTLAVTKQIDLYAVAANPALVPPRPEPAFPVDRFQAPDRARAEPLLTPPRGVAVL